MALKGGARKGAGRKKGIGITYEIQKHCDRFIREILSNDKIKAKALKQLTLIDNDPVDGFVYILNSNGLYKIGYTKQIDSRIKHYKSHSNIDVVFVLKTKKAFELESLAIDRFRKNLAYGTEWFNLTDKELIEVIAYLTNQMLSNGWC